MAALELGRRFVSLAPQERAVINSPQDVANLLLADMSVLDQEHLRILLLNTRNEVLGIQEIYVGNVNSSVVRAAEVFRPAVQANAPSIIVVHNHRRETLRPVPKTWTSPTNLSQRANFWASNCWTTSYWAEATDSSA